MTKKVPKIHEQKTLFIIQQVFSKKLQKLVPQIYPGYTLFSNNLNEGSLVEETKSVALSEFCYSCQLITIR